MIATSLKNLRPIEKNALFLGQVARGVASGG